MEHNIDNKNNDMSDDLSKGLDTTGLNLGSEENIELDEKDALDLSETAEHNLEGEQDEELLVNTNREGVVSEKEEIVSEVSETDEIVEDKGDETPNDESEVELNDQDSSEALADKDDGVEVDDENTEKDSEKEETEDKSQDSKSVVKLLAELGYFEDFEKIENHKEIFTKWRDIIIALPKFLDTIIYRMTEVISQPEFGIEKPKSILYFPCSNLFKEKVNSVLSVRDKLNDSKYLNEETSPNDLESIDALNIRKPEDYDFILTNEINLGEQNKLFKKVLENIVLALKTLNRQQKRLFEMLIDVSKASAMLTDIYSKYSSVIIECYKYESSTDIKIDEEKIKGLYDKVYEEIRNYEDSYGKIDMTPKLQKKFQENMSSGVFKAIDNLILTKEFFEDSYQPLHDDDIVSTHPDFSALCEQLIDKLKTDLYKELGIEMMPVKRGDQFNIEHHTPFIEPEPDEELEDGLIKKVINNGFKMGDEILKNCEVIVVRNVK